METMIGEMMTPYGRAIVWRGTYLTPDGPTAIWADGEDGQRIATLSVNLVDHPPPPDHFWVPRWNLSANIMNALRTFPKFTDTGQRTPVVGPFDAVAELWRVVE